MRPPRGGDGVTARARVREIRTGKVFEAELTTERETGRALLLVAGQLADWMGFEVLGNPVVVSA